MPQETNPIPLWVAAPDFMAGADVTNYRAALQEMKEQFRSEYPEVSARTMVMDPTQPTLEQAQAYLTQATTSGVLSAQEAGEFKKQLAVAQDTFYTDFKERNSNGRLIALTQDFDINGKKFQIIIPPPADRATLNEALITTAHELNHAVEMHRFEGIETHRLTPDTVQSEWRAVLAEYAYSYAKNPTEQNLKELQLRQTSRIVSLGGGTPEQGDEHLAATYPYAVSKEAFDAMIDQVQAQIAKGEKPSLHGANAIADRVANSYAPDTAKINADVAQYKQAYAIRGATVKDLQDGQGLQQFHEALAQNPSPRLQELATAQNEKVKLLKEIYPEETALIARGETLPSFALEEQRSRKLDQYQGMTNIESYARIGPEEKDIIMGYDAQKKEAILGVDLDNNPTTGESGYDKFLHLDEKGKVSVSESLEGPLQALAETPNAQAQAYFQSAQATFENHQLISNIDLNELKKLGTALGDQVKDLQSHDLPPPSQVSNAKSASQATASEMPRGR